MFMEINADNLRMVNGQIKPINGMTEKLVSIFNSLNRESFMPEEFKEIADKVFASDLDLHQPYSNSKFMTIPYTKNGANEDAQYVLKELQVPYDAENANWIIANAKADKVVLNTRKIVQDLKNGFIPNLKGMGIQDVLFLLENSGLKVNFSGKGAIKSQSLKKGERFQNGSNIILELA